MCGQPSYSLCLYHSLWQVPYVLTHSLSLGKLLLMLQSVKRAHAIDPNHPKLHEHLVKLAVKGEGWRFEQSFCSVLQT